MKRILLLIAAVVCLAASYGQKNQTNPFMVQEYEYLPDTYLGISTGINNMVGLLGVQLKFVVSPEVIIGAGAGIGSWGYKLSGNIELHPKGVYGLFFKGGYMHASGLEEVELEMETADRRNQNVWFELKPVGNVFLSVGHAWKLGLTTRFYIEGGYAIPLVTGDYYEILSGEKLSDDSELVMQMMRPGGLIIALGFDFGI